MYLLKTPTRWVNDMTKSIKEATLEYSAKDIWDIITSNTNYTWRSDVSKIVILDEGKRFIEYTHGGYATTFTITHYEPYVRYEFDMDNTNMSGHWSGVLIQTDKGTTCRFTENVSVKKLLMKPFVKGYLRKQQEQYFTDLVNALNGKKDNI